MLAERLILLLAIIGTSWVCLKYGIYPITKELLQPVMIKAKAKQRKRIAESELIAAQEEAEIQRIETQKNKITEETFEELLNQDAKRR